jgi:predicted HNH restriction endonuclease
MTVTTEELIAEIAKCVCLCMNCHKKVHEGLLIC